MVSASKNLTATGWGGPWHWKLVLSSDGTCRIVPRDHNALAGLSFIVIVLVLTVVCVLAHIPVAAKVTFCILGGIAGICISGLIVMINRREQLLGPYFVFDGNAIYLRQERIRLADFASFEISRSWQNTGLGRIQVSHLVLLCRTGVTCEILHSINNPEIVHLKKTLDEKVAPAIVEKSPGATGYASVFPKSS